MNSRVLTRYLIPQRKRVTSQDRKVGRCHLNQMIIVSPVMRQTDIKGLLMGFNVRNTLTQCVTRI